MTSSARLPLRLAGVALIVAGVGLALTAGHPSIIAERSVAEVVRDTGSWRFIHYSAALGSVGAVVGVAGIVALHDERLGAAGYFAAYAAMVGFAVTGMIMAMEAVLFPAVADAAPEVIAWNGPILGRIVFRAVGGIAGFAQLGLIALGVLAYRDSAYRAAALGLIAGPVAFIAFGFWFVPVVGPLSIVAFGASLAWWGVLALRQPSGVTTA